MAPNLIDPARLLKCDIVDCRPPAAPSPQSSIPQKAQSIDYLAKDYDSFLRGMMDLIPSRLPGWKTRTEADLGMALLELFAYAGDQLSYYQDRVINEGFLGSAVEYESVRRMLSLIDYHMAPGLAARSFLKVTALAAKPVGKGFAVSTKTTDRQPAVVFEAIEARIVYPALNDIALKIDAPSQAIEAVLNGEFDTLSRGQWVWLESTANAEWAQLGAPIVVDPIQHTTTVRFSAPLKGNYPAASTHINGNGVAASHGESHEQRVNGTGAPNQQVALEFAPLTYVRTADGEARCSLAVEVAGKPWGQVEDFIDCGPTDLKYTLTRDNEGFVTVNFGNGQQGRRPDAGAPIETRYRSGIGEAGLVAPGTLTRFRDPDLAIGSITNPEPSFGAANPESLTEARLAAPRTIHRQNRAVTAQDYADALLGGVPLGGGVIAPLHAKAQFVWTGSWVSVVVSVDFADRRPLADVPERRRALEAALEARKLAGFDVQVEDARYARLNIALMLHVKPEFFVKQVRQEVERIVRPPGFFAPSNFGFGEAVRLSDLYSAVLAVEGVHYLTVTRFKRLGDRYPDHAKDGVIDIGPLEIARCDNDPAFPENGVFHLRTCGGKEG